MTSPSLPAGKSHLLPNSSTPTSAPPVLPVTQPLRFQPFGPHRSDASGCLTRTQVQVPVTDAELALAEALQGYIPEGQLQQETRLQGQRGVGSMQAQIRAPDPSQLHPSPFPVSSSDTGYYVLPSPSESQFSNRSLLPNWASNGQQSFLQPVVQSGSSSHPPPGTIDMSTGVSMISSLAHQFDSTQQLNLQNSSIIGSVYHPDTLAESQPISPNARIIPQTQPHGEASHLPITVPSPFTQPNNLSHESDDGSTIESMSRKRLLDSVLANNLELDRRLRIRNSTDASQPESSTVTAPSTPSTAHSSARRSATMQYLPRLEAFSNQRLAHGLRDEFVSQRISLLREASYQDDFFYLCLHQIFCRATADPLSTLQIGFGNEQIHGLNAIQAVLLSNTGLPLDVLKFFADFPIPSQSLTGGSELQRHVVAQVRAFLSQLWAGWQELREFCLRRGFPPFAAELRFRLLVGSSILQKIFFNSIHRQLGGSDQSSWSELARRMFDDDQRTQQIRLDSGQGPPTEVEVVAQSCLLGNRYLNLRRLSQAQILALNGSGPTLGANSSQPLPRPPILNPNLVRQKDTLNLAPQMAQNIRRASSSASQHASPPSGTLTTQPVGHSVSSSSNNVEMNQEGGSLTSRSHPTPAVPSPATRHQYSGDQSPNGASSKITPSQSTPAPRRRGRPPLSSHPQRPSRRRAPVVVVTANSSRNWWPRGAVYSQPVSTLSDQNANPGLLLPGFDMEPIQALNPNTARVALHQAHLRSPKYQKIDRQGVEEPQMRLYQSLDGFALAPWLLGAQSPFFRWHFYVSAADLQSMARDIADDDEKETRALRRVSDGSQLYRLRCIQVPLGATAVDEDTWVVKETSWPNCCFLSLNDVPLEMRRRTHHGKDLSLDLTPYIREGENIVTLSFLRTKEEATLKFFAIAVEIIKVVDQNRIQLMLQQLRAADAIMTITKGLDQISSRTDEDELQLVDSHISIDIVDPFTAKIFNIPVRGKTCLHRECFDFDTFLQTRKSREKDGPTNPEEWKCPICKKDARPQSLIVDGFLQNVREELEDKNLLHTKAILVSADGSWVPKTERNVDDIPRRESSNSASTPGKGKGEERQPARSSSIVIELDD